MQLACHQVQRIDTTPAAARRLGALLAFNLGVELGQLLVLAVTLPLLTPLLTRLIPERAGVIVLSALAARTAWHWMLKRAQTAMSVYGW